MPIPRKTLVLALTVTLAAPLFAAPVTALAQSAGDDQYEDPFQNPDQGGGGGGGGGSEGESGDDQGGSAPPADTGEAPPADTGETIAPEPVAPATGAGEAAGATASDAPTLPSTGLPAAVVAAAGLLLLASGLALRRRA